MRKKAFISQLLYLSICLSHLSVSIHSYIQLAPPPEPITICVVDTGYDLGHVDLPNSVSHGVTGWEPNSAYNQGDWHIDGHSHRTHCAGTIGALGNNGQGVVGVFDDPNKFRFHIAKGLSDTGSGSGEFYFTCIKACILSYLEMYLLDILSLHSLTIPMCTHIHRSGCTRRSTILRRCRCQSHLHVPRLCQLLLGC